VELEPVTIEIWRPGRHDRRPRGRQDQRRGDHRKGQGPKGGRDDKRHGKGGKGGPGRNRGQQGGKGFDGGNRRDNKPARDKPIDPNSPFAALMALKADMDNKDKK